MLIHSRRASSSEDTFLNPPTLDLPEAPETVLQRTLSARSVISTASSFAARINQAGINVTENVLRVIGLGSCGTVLEIPGSQLAYKKGIDIKAIWKDFCLTNRVHTSVAQVSHLIQARFKELAIPQVPKCHEFMLPVSSTWWDANIQRFPESHRTRGAVFLVDRILPLPKMIREALIKLYFDDEVDAQREALEDEDNKDCLIRLYLGQDEQKEQIAFWYESLRNFPLRLNMMEKLDLDINTFAREMAIGLSIVHWQAKVDGMDMEFVLGSSSASKEIYSLTHIFDIDTPPHEVFQTDFQKRDVHLWMLDFDKATPIQLSTDDVISKLVPSFLGNDPYYPRPDMDEDLWEVFCDVYLETSKLILEQNSTEASIMQLPRLFIDKVVENIEKYTDWDPEENIVFGG